MEYFCNIGKIHYTYRTGPNQEGYIILTSNDGITYIINTETKVLFRTWCIPVHRSITIVAEGFREDITLTPEVFARFVEKYSDSSLEGVSITSLGQCEDSYEFTEEDGLLNSV